MLIGVAAVAYWQLRPRPATPPPTQIPPAPSGNVAVTARPFASWMRFEPNARNRDLLETYYVDIMLGHQVFKMLPRGVPAQVARGLLLDDDDLLLSSGLRLWNKELLPQPGMLGKFCYIHSQFCLKRLFEVHFVVDGTPVVLYDNMYAIQRFPSRTVVRYTLPGVSVDEHKFITADDRAVSSFQLRSADGKPHVVTVDVLSQNVIMPNSAGATPLPLLGKGEYQGRPLYVYLDAPGFEKLDAYPFLLRRSVQLDGSDEPRRLNVAASFETAERPPDAEPLPDDIVERHVVEYQQWFADNVPYFDAPDAAYKKMWYYRWWVVRFSMAKPDSPDLHGYAFYEGKLGFDNLITFAVPAQLEELKYLRDPRFGIDQARNAYRNPTSDGAAADAPGSPYWGEAYSQWIAGAVADFNRVHPIDHSVLQQMLPAMAADVRAWTTAYDPDHDLLPSRDTPRITGYDLDILSWWFFDGLKFDPFHRPPAQERVDFASFVYANAAGVAELAKEVGDQALEKEFTALAQGIRDAVLKELWDPRTAFFYPQTADGDKRVPIRELHGFFPFTMRLAPDEPQYTRALQHMIDPQDFWARFPPVIASLEYYQRWTWDMNGLTRNIAPHPISMGGLTLIRALHDYHQSIIQPSHFMHLLDQYTALMYPNVYPGDPTWRPNAHEYYSEWEPGSRSGMPKPSDISHDFHSMWCALVVEGLIGLTPRNDERIELRPAALDWPYFALDRLRYHGHDLTIIWDRPGDGQVHYPGYPEGLSLYIDGKLAMTRPSLDPVSFDPRTNAIEELKN